MRLRRASPGMVGCFFTMARVSASAKREIKRENREFEILVFDPKEVELLFRGQHHVDDLLQAKRDKLRIEGKVWFHRSEGAQRITEPSVIDLPRQQARFRSQQTVTTAIEPDGRGGDHVFALRIPETGWGLMGDFGARLTLMLTTETLSELAELFEMLHSHLCLTGRGTFAIHQTGASWHGIGVRELLAELQQWRARYRRAHLSSPHHSEEIVYFDACRNGWVLVTSQQVLGANCVDNTELEIRLPGFPLDSTAFLSLCRGIGCADPEMNQVCKKDHYIFSFRNGRKPTLDVIDLIVESDGSRKLVTGLVAKNPFLDPKMPLPPLGPEQGEELRSSSVIICSVLLHHPVETKVDHYDLVKAEAIWMAPRPIIRFTCAWHRLRIPA